MVRKGIYVILALLCVIVIMGCQRDKKADTMTVSQLKNSLKNERYMVVLDVRNPDELNGPLGKIDGAINIPVQDLEKRINELDKYKDNDIAVICRSGHRSAKAQKILSQHGFKSRSVSGGMTELRKEEEKKK